MQANQQLPLISMCVIPSHRACGYSEDGIDPADLKRDILKRLNGYQAAFITLMELNGNNCSCRLSTTLYLHSPTSLSESRLGDWLDSSPNSRLITYS